MTLSCSVPFDETTPTDEIKFDISKVETTEASLEPEAQAEALQLNFITPLQNQEALSGESVGLFCEMSHAGVEVVWLKDNQPLSLADDRYQIVNKDNTSHLVIPSATPDDRGSYTVQVGDLQSTAVLTVHGESNKN